TAPPPRVGSDLKDRERVRAARRQTRWGLGRFGCFGRLDRLGSRYRRLSTLVRGDELLGQLTSFIVGSLIVRRLHQVAGRAVKLAADAVVERELDQADRVDDDAGRVR